MVTVQQDMIEKLPLLNQQSYQEKSTEIVKGKSKIDLKRKGGKGPILSEVKKISDTRVVKVIADNMGSGPSRIMGSDRGVITHGRDQSGKQVEGVTGPKNNEPIIVETKPMQTTHVNMHCEEANMGTVEGRSESSSGVLKLSNSGADLVVYNQRPPDTSVKERGGNNDSNGEVRNPNGVVTVDETRPGGDF